MTRQVVITADDFGREPATNDTIAALLAEGNISATTLITVSPTADDAVRRAAQLGVTPHLHVTLSSEHGLPAWRPLSGGDAFPSSCTPTEAIREAQAQLDWMRRRGRPPTTADSHAGTLYGLPGGPGAEQMVGAALHWCAKNGLAFRLPRDPTSYFGSALPGDLARLHELAVARADEWGVALPQTIATNRSSAADLGSYERLRDGYLRRLAALPEGTSELFLHPSSEDAVAGPDGIVRVWEARLLRDPKWHEALASEGIAVVADWSA